MQLDNSKFKPGFSLNITNERILSFYERNPHINFEAVNLIFLDLFEHILDDMESVLNSTINTQILENTNILREKLKDLDQNMNDFLSKNMERNKNMFIESVKNLFTSNFSQQTDKISGELYKNIDIIIDKTKNILRETIPHTHEPFQRSIEANITVFKDKIHNDITHFLSTKNKNDEVVSNFLQNLERKYDNMYVPILDMINSSENRVQKSILSLHETQEKHSNIRLMNDLQEYLNKYKGSSYKGQLGENHLEVVLNNMYPSGEITNTTGTPHACDFRLCREKKPTILVETKNYNRNVTTKEVSKFIRDIETQQQHGIFLSQHSGISSRQNYQIEIIDKNIAVYVHNVEYNPEHIKIAIDIIDSLHPKISILTENNKNNTNISIHPDTIQELNKEYNSVVERKTALLQTLKDFQKTMNQQIDMIQMPNMISFLSKHLERNILDTTENSTTKHLNTIICNICNQFNATNNKSLAAHKRYCKKKSHKNIDISLNEPNKNENKKMKQTTIKINMKT